MSDSTHIVGQNEVGTTQSHRVPRCAPDISILDQTRGNSRAVLAPPLQEGEDDNEDAENDEESNDTSIAPVVAGATPLKRKQQTDNGGQEDEGPEQVKFAQLLSPITLLLECLIGGEEKEDAEEGHGSDGQVDVETPAPGELISECTSQARRVSNESMQFSG